MTSEERMYNVLIYLVRFAYGQRFAEISNAISCCIIETDRPRK